jgi:predicted RNase H-like HicB family nuclease
VRLHQPDGLARPLAEVYSYVDAFRSTLTHSDLSRPINSPVGVHIVWLEATTAPLCENQGVQKYAVVIHEDAEGGFWAEVPALPGCYSQGESMDELMANVREAITGVLEVMEEQGTRPEANIQILDVAV